MITMTRRVFFSSAGSGSAEPATTVVSGHNYVLDVSVSGGIDARTGILVNIKELDRIVRERIVQDFDTNLLKLVETESGKDYVTEDNLLRRVVDALRGAIPATVQTSRLRLQSGPLCGVEWQAEGSLPSKELGSVYLTRGYEFSASHRLHSPHLSPEENRLLFGKCNNEYGHGHNYEIEITVCGPVDAQSGRVIDPPILDEIVRREVIDRYDHRHFNHDIPEFVGVVPSAEIITTTIWNRVVSLIPSPARLYRVLLRETARNIFEYYGEV